MEKSWQDWAQWVGSCILIPVIGVIAWKVFDNSERLAVMESRQAADHEMLSEIRDDVKDLTRLFMTIEVVDNDR